MSYEFEVYSSDAEAAVKIDGFDVLYVAPTNVVMPPGIEDEDGEKRKQLFAEHGERLYERIARGLKSDDVLDETSGVRYVPWTDGYAVGFECKLPDGTSEFIYLNPSTSADDGVPNVFLYQGTAGNVARDGAEHHYAIGYGNESVRLEYLRGELRAERISMGELLELQGYGERGVIDAGDMELLEAAGVPEEDVRSGAYPNRWVVSDSHGVQPGEQIPELGRFASHDEGAEFISTLPDHESGRYSLTGPSDDES